ncbi:hypothetical protein CC78DRAFT_564775 [Lojkania enalia]|uniref:Uncharacterized protein n=1 Tax=Lojkania enalia TaxID=147567 RepID=A0A9P4NAC4_9PLEO|nr:hypothetical protein CC78DRAFT_564775 [Didymosphaeria enalia]
MKAAIALLSLVAIAQASALTKNYCRSTRKTYTAQYDDLPFIETGSNPLPNPYRYLTYTAFQIEQYDGFIPPTSGNQWTMAFGGSGNISLFDPSPKTSFQLESFSFSCVAGVPQPECAISIWGTKASGSVIKRTIRYPRLDPGHALEDFKMNKTAFGLLWRDLKSIRFSIARADNGGDMFGGLALDDVKYTITTKC